MRSRPRFSVGVPPWKAGLPWMWLALIGCVRPASSLAFTLLTYNVSGNGTTDWSTNAPQVQALGRQMIFLQPDIITFNEVPFTNTWQMTNFVAAYLPGYAQARFSGTDGFLRSVILSRFPIVREQKWLDGAPLDAFGYAGRFTRDLFEAEVRLPGLARPLHVFTTHLKSGADAESAARRAAEAGAISNWLVTVFLPACADRPYVLTGDLNEDVRRPPSTSRQPVQRLANAATGLHLTTPVNPLTGDERTISTRAGLTARFDYILPCAALFTNIVRSQVFRASLLAPRPAPLLEGDERTASDHLPVLMEFGGPFEGSLRVRVHRLDGDWLELAWPAWPRTRYEVQRSSDLVKWEPEAGDLVAADQALTWRVPAAAPWRFLRVVWRP